MAKQKSKKPTRKVIAQAVVTIASAAAMHYGLDISPEVNVAATTLIAFGLAYIIPPHKDDGVA